MIRRLRARNFRAFQDLQSPEFAKTNVILGLNGAGKSSVKDLISLLFSGTASGAETGLGLDGLRTIGGAPSKRWQIDALLDDEAISRTETEGPRSAKQQFVESITKVPGSRARACIESGELVRLDAKARQRLLMDLAPRAVIALPPPIRKALADLLNEVHAEIDLGTLERLYKAAYEARSEAQRIVKAAGENEAPAVPDGLADIEDLDAELHEVKALLVSLRSERDAAIAKAAPKTVDIRPYQHAVDKTGRELERIQQEIGTLPTKLEIARRAKEIVAKMADAGATNEEIEAKRHALKDRLGAADGAMRAAKSALDIVKAQRGEVGTCPVCESKLTKVGRGRLETSLTNKYEAAARDRQRITEELSTAVDPLSTVALDREASELQAKEHRLVKLLEDEIRVAAQLLIDQGALAQAEEAPGDPGDSDAAAAAEQLAARIAKGEGIRDALVSYIAERKAYETGLASKASSMKRHAALDQLVTDLGPGGIRKSCGNAGMLGFHDALNTLLKQRGFTVDLRPALDLEGDPLVTIKGRQIPLGMLSNGERIAFGAAFACAVASVTGLGIVCVDNFERLDPEAHDAVMGILESSGHQVFVFSVERDGGAEAMATEVNTDGGSMRVFLLRDGQLVAPGVAAAKETAA